MIEFPNWFAGSFTLAALIGLGIFLYPWLLKQRGGSAIVGAITVALSVLFYLFDQDSGVSFAVSMALAILWALAPVAAGVIVYRLQRRSTQTG